jgi:hypothetical protein
MVAPTRRPHNAYFRHNRTDAVIVLIFDAEPITDHRTYGPRSVAECEQIAITAERTLNASLCSLVEL